ncbi:MAG: FHA domain-containing protein [Pseudomonadota bacterium]
MIDQALSFRSTAGQMPDWWSHVSSSLLNALGICRDVAGQVAGAYAEMPSLVIALGICAAIPVLAIIGRMLPTRRSTRPTERLQTRLSMRPMRSVSNTPDLREVTVQPPRGVGRISFSSGRSEVVMNSAAALKIGSGQDCDVRLDGDGIADLHALVLIDPEGQFQILRLVGDEDDAVGIYVDGQTIRSQCLVGDELIRIGAHLFTFHNDCHGLDPMPVHSDGDTRGGARTKHGTGETEWAGIVSSKAKRVPARSGARYLVH